MDLSNRNIGYGITGSFCTFAKTRKEIQRLTEMGAHVIPIFSYQTQNCDTRFGTAKEFMEEVCDITGNPGIRTLQEAEPIGPKGYLDVMAIAPCTGNSAAKLANAITDTPVLMAAKAHMRNGKPLVIAISTNDALGASFKNIGMLMNTKHIYFVPFAQDNYEKNQIRWWQKWNFCRRRFQQLWKESSCSRWYGDKKAPRQICLGRLLHNPVMVLCIFLCIIGFAQCLGKLITAGGVFHAAVNTGDTAFHFFNSHALNQTGNCLKISLTAAGEFNIFNNISVQLHFDLCGTGAFCFVNIRHGLLPSFLFLPCVWNTIIVLLS